MVSVISSHVLVQNDTCYHLMSRLKVIQSNAALENAIPDRREVVAPAWSSDFFAHIQNNFSISFFNLPGYVEQTRGGGGGFNFAQRSKKAYSCWWGTSLWHFSTHKPTLSTWCCFFFPVQVFNLSGSYAERGAVQGGAGGGLMGTRHEGKQASKPQQKPQTWPGVKHDSLVTCQAASGVITPNTVDYITLNSTQSERGERRANRAEHLGKMCFLNGHERLRRTSIFCILIWESSVNVSCSNPPGFIVSEEPLQFFFFFFFSLSLLDFTLLNKWIFLADTCN